MSLVGGRQLSVDRIRCDGAGLCAELLPEMITLDDWGYPILTAGAVRQDLVGLAARAVEACPVLALRLRPIEAPGSTTARAAARPARRA